VLGALHACDSSKKARGRAPRAARAPAAVENLIGIGCARPSPSPKRGIHELAVPGWENNPMQVARLAQGRPLDQTSPKAFLFDSEHPLLDRRDTIPDRTHTLRYVDRSIITLPKASSSKALALALA